MVYDALIGCVPHPKETVTAIGKNHPQDHAHMMLENRFKHNTAYRVHLRIRSSLTNQETRQPTSLIESNIFSKTCWKKGNLLDTVASIGMCFRQCKECEHYVFPPLLVFCHALLEQLPRMTLLYVMCTRLNTHLRPQHSRSNCWTGVDPPPRYSTAISHQRAPENKKSLGTMLYVYLKSSRIPVVDYCSLKFHSIWTTWYWKFRSRNEITQAMPCVPWPNTRSLCVARQ